MMIDSNCDPRSLILWRQPAIFAAVTVAIGLIGPLTYGQITGTNSDLLTELLYSGENREEISRHFRKMTSEAQIRAIKDGVLSMYAGPVEPHERSRLVLIVPAILPPAEGIDFLLNELVDLDNPRDALAFSTAVREFDLSTDIPSQELLTSYLTSLCTVIRSDQDYAPVDVRKRIDSMALLALANCGASGLNALMTMENSSGSTYDVIGMIGSKEALDFLISELENSQQFPMALKALAPILFRLEDAAQRKTVVDGIYSQLNSDETFVLIEGAVIAGLTADPQFIPRLTELTADVSYMDTKGINGVRVEYYPLGEEAQRAIEYINRANNRSYVRERYLIEKAIPLSQRHVQNAEDAMAQGTDLEYSRARLSWATKLLNEELAELAELQAGQR